jgi:hypothetical protein
VAVKFDSELVEYIVREVIRRLTANGQLTATSSSQPVATARELHLTDRLVTLASLQGRLDGVREIITVRNAVITPAARDELTKRRIVLKKG